ncbi:hypothetical protein TeGR_g2466 [Tetraparma gracilis]|uniref:Uncharacterized protein n=1 Tax=Tetraparma gracilis TaxID=2962635 RepID=A0ABQ6MM41_9STRA|nr:hypothetical protein TeGR_g2466 [Tetraparma gracilis]
MRLATLLLFSLPLCSPLSPPSPRRAFLLSLPPLALASPALALGPSKPDPALAGTKADPEYQACLSQKLYDCTKPKGGEQRSRGECLAEIKPQCATTKQQLLRGVAK